MASSKQHFQTPRPDDEPAAKRFRSDPPSGSQEPGGSLRVRLNPADCDLDFDIQEDGLRGHALHEQGFAYCWSGSRANVGITGGKYCFGCKIVSEQVVDMADTPSDQQHVCRVGISRGDDPVGNLGETLHSFGFGGTGKFSNAGKFSDYGMKFGIGDTIICAVDLENRPLATIGFFKNGKWLGIAREFDAGSRGLGVVDTTQRRNLPWESALFPHVLLKNVVVQLQFDIEDGLVPEEGYKPWSCAIEDGNVIVGPSFPTPKECEVLMMVGLPASGKTTWAEKWVKEHPEKRYVLLGTNLALDQMKVPGLLRKQNYGERFERLMDRATGIFNTLLARAAKTPRSYILDQTNVYRNARNRKLKPFINFRKVAVVVFPTPNDLKLRADKRFKEMGKEVPQSAVNEMLANYVLPMSKNMPGSNEIFDEVMFVELSREEAQRHLDEMKCALRSPGLSANFSPYSCESSMQSFSSNAVMNEGAIPCFPWAGYRESSVHSFSSPTAVNKEATSAVGGQWPTARRAIFHDHDNLNSPQVNPAYPRSGSYIDHRARSGETSLSLPANSPYGNYSNYDTTSFRRDGSNPYQSHGESSPYIRSASERSFSSIGDPSLYQTQRGTEDFIRPSYESPSSMSRPTYGYLSDPPSHGSHNAHRHDSILPQVPQHDFRRPRFECPSSPYEYQLNLPFCNSTSACLTDQGPLPVDQRTIEEPPYKWHSPHQATYGSPSANPPIRPPSGASPPVNRPYGSYFR